MSNSHDKMFNILKKIRHKNEKVHDLIRIIYYIIIKVFNLKKKKNVKGNELSNLYLYPYFTASYQTRKKHHILSIMTYFYIIFFLIANKKETLCIYYNVCPNMIVLDRIKQPTKRSASSVEDCGCVQGETLPN